MKIIFSKTGQVHGYGTDQFKWVSHLTKSEREAVQNGQIVIVESDRRSHGRTGTYYRQVHHNQRGYYQRVPKVSDAEIEKAKEL